MIDSNASGMLICINNASKRDNQMTIAAYFYPKTKNKSAQLDIATISDNGHRVWVRMDIDVTDKRHARKVAAEYNATPWNF